MMTTSWVSRGRISNWFANIVVPFLSVTHLILVEHTFYSGRAQASISSGRPHKGFLEVKEAQANMEHKSIIDALRAAAPTWQFQQIYLVVRKCQSVVMRKSLLHQALEVREGKKDKLFADHVTQLCKAHDRVILLFLQQVQRIARPTTKGSRENIGHV